MCSRSAEKAGLLINDDKLHVGMIWISKNQNSESVEWKKKFGQICIIILIVVDVFGIKSTFPPTAGVIWRPRPTFNISPERG